MLTACLSSQGLSNYDGVGFYEFFIWLYVRRCIVFFFKKQTAQLDACF
jgi:hypothetical protein